MDTLLRAVGDGFICLFAAWTVCAHAVVQSGLSFAVLEAISPLALAAGVALFAWSRRAPALSPELAEEPATGDGGDRTRLFWLVAGASAGLAWALLPPAAAWVWSLVVLAAGLLWRAEDGVPAPAAAATSRGDLVLLALCTLLAAAATLVTHRPDPDDSLYLSMAVSVLDTPEAPIWVTDTLHRIPGAPYVPTYRLHTIELLFAMLAQLFGTQPIVVAHLVLPPLFAVVAVCGIARLARFLIGRWWSVATLATVAVLLAVRGSHFIYGNFGFVRMFQGKGVFVTCAVPLIVALALEQAYRPDRRRWALLAAVQIAAIGLTANGLYLAPLAAGFALAAGARWQIGELRRLLPALASSFYPLAMGLLLLYQLHALGVEMAAAEPVWRLPVTLAGYFGRQTSRALWLGAFVAAPAAFTGPRRRWAAALALLFSAPFLCPWLDTFWARALTGPHLLWRLFWAVPLPLLLAALVLILFRAGRDRWGVTAGGALLAAGLAVVAVLGGRSTNLADLGLGRPSLKVPPLAYAVATRVVATAEPSSQLLACSEVADWIPTFRGHPSLVASREAYLQPQIRLFPAWARTARLEERLRLRSYVSGDSSRPPEAALLAAWLEREAITIVVLAPSIPAWDPIHAVLRDHGFAATVVYGYPMYRRTAKPSR